MPDLEKYVISLSEKELTETLVIPLCQALGFKSVEYRGGPNELGIDVLCIQEDELDERDIVGIQIKKLPFTGNVQKQGHLYGVINQLQQILAEKVKLKDGSQAKVDRAWFISPYQLNRVALDSAFGRLEGASSRQLRIIDGPKLLQLIRRKAPELLHELGDPFAAYRQQFSLKIARHNEAPAFRLRKRRAIETFFVELQAEPLAGHLSILLDRDSYFRLTATGEQKYLEDGALKKRQVAATDSSSVSSRQAEAVEGLEIYPEVVDRLI